MRRPPVADRGRARALDAGPCGTAPIALGRRASRSARPARDLGKDHHPGGVKTPLGVPSDALFPPGVIIAKGFERNTNG